MNELSKTIKDIGRIALEAEGMTQGMRGSRGTRIGVPLGLESSLVHVTEIIR